MKLILLSSSTPFSAWAMFQREPDGAKSNTGLTVVQDRFLDSFVVRLKRHEVHCRLALVLFEQGTIERVLLDDRPRCHEVEDANRNVAIILVTKGFHVEGARLLGSEIVFDGDRLGCTTSFLRQSFGDVGDATTKVVRAVSSLREVKWLRLATSSAKHNANPHTT